jgi:hypothetical protein
MKDDLTNSIFAPSAMGDSDHDIDEQLLRAGQGMKSSNLSHSVRPSQLESGKDRPDASESEYDNKLSSKMSKGQS